MSNISIAERFWAKVHIPEDQPDACWEWLASKKQGGYGQFYMNPQHSPAHRVAYELVRGSIPEGLQIDHLCRTPAYVRPAHLEAVTGEENLKRAPGTWASNIHKTHCPQGHEYTPENTRYDRQRRRSCKKCRYVATVKYRAKKRGR